MPSFSFLRPGRSRRNRQQSVVSDYDVSTSEAATSSADVADHGAGTGVDADAPSALPGAFLCELASRYCENTRRVCQEPASILLDGFLPMCRSLWELLVNTLFEMLHQAWRSLSASVYALFLTIVASMEPPMRMARELCESSPRCQAGCANRLHPAKQTVRMRSIDGELHANAARGAGPPPRRRAS